MNIGIIGGGQLGRMLKLAGQALGLRFRILQNCDHASSSSTALSFANNYELQRFRGELNVATYETENASAECIEWLEEHVPVLPSSQALRVCQNRLHEKQLFAALGIPTTRFQTINSEQNLTTGVAALGLPCVLKTQLGGYDGKGQYLLNEADQVSIAWQELGARPLILEEYVPFERELSMLAVRSRSGEVAFYPLVENWHRSGILRYSYAPASDVTDHLQQQAEQYALQILERLNYVGVLAIEFFQRNGQLIANEMAPRVHNSGHWTIEGAVTSQFENHLRAILDWPLGDTSMRANVAMFNCIGNMPPPEKVLAIPNAHLHCYDKAAAPRRKLGHITLCWSTNEPVPTAAIERLRLLTQNAEHESPLLC